MDDATQQLFVALSYSVSAAVVLGLMIWVIVSVRSAKARVGKLEASIASQRQNITS
jgi:hypothetical protein